MKLEEIPGRLDVFRRLFTNPDSFKPEKTTEAVTPNLAKEFGKLSDRLSGEPNPGPISFVLVRLGRLCGAHSSATTQVTVTSSKTELLTTMPTLPRRLKVSRRCSTI